MPSNLLVSASADVKVWDLKSVTGEKNTNEIETSKAVPEQLLGVEVASFVPNDTSTAVNVARWSHDNQLLAVAGNDGTLTIHNFQGQLVETIPLNNSAGDYADINALRFLNKSQYVLFGGSDKIINIWDRKESAFIEPLKGHRSTITCIDLNMDESIVASSALNGNIIIHNRQKSNSWNNLTVLTKQPINVLQYSYVKRGLLAAGGEDGSLRLWDTSVSTTAIQTYEKAHHSEIKGIAFSPSNQHLLISAGMDKRIVLYDVSKKECLKNIHTESPLTALAFRSDCVTIAAGTLQGKIFIYDLRSHNKAMCTLYGHEPHPIQCLHFQEKDRSFVRRPTLNRNKGSHARTSSRGSILPASSDKSTKVPSTPSPPAPSESKEKNYMDMFSPVKDAIEDSTINDVKPTSKNATKTPLPVKNDIPSPGIIDGLKMRVKDAIEDSAINDVKPTSKNTTKMPLPVKSDILSPGIIDGLKTRVKDAIEDSTVNDVKPTSKNTTKTSLPVKNDVISPGIIDDLKTRIVTKVGETLNEVGKLPTIGNGDSVFPDTSSKKRVVFMGHEQIPKNDYSNENNNTTTTSVTNSNVNHMNYNGTNSTNENIDTTTSTSSNNTNHIYNATSAMNENVDTSTSNNTTSTATNFQLQVIGSVVDECLQDFRISLRNDIQNMHLELLRQFHIQKTEMEMMFLKYCGETMSLREEVERLREENQRLKMKY